MKNTVQIDRATYFIYEQMKGHANEVGLMQSLADMVNMKVRLMSTVTNGNKQCDYTDTFVAFTTLLDNSVYQSLRSVYEHNEVVLDSELNICFDDNAISVYGTTCQVENVNESDFEEEDIEFDKSSVTDNIDDEVRDIGYEVEEHEAHICWDDMHKSVVRPSYDDLLLSMNEDEMKLSSDAVCTYVENYVNDHIEKVRTDSYMSLVSMLSSMLVVAQKNIHEKEIADGKS